VRRFEQGVTLGFPVDRAPGRVNLFRADKRQLKAERNLSEMLKPLASCQRRHVVAERALPWPRIRE
jgi:hypothetical protein